MMKCGSKCLLIIGAGLLFGGALSTCAASCHLWSSLAVGLGIGVCMALGEDFSKQKESAG